jgi:hypothetical protein
LNNKKFCTTTIIIAGRTGNPKPMRQGAKKKMKSGDICAHISWNFLIMGKKDKRMVLMLFTYNDTPIENVATILKGGQKEEI